MPSSKSVSLFRSHSRSRLPLLTAAIVFSLFALALVLVPTRSVQAVSVLLSGWSFEGVTTTNTGQTPIVSAGSAAADSGALTAGSFFTAFHTSTSTVWSNPAGNGS
ncbi:MAG TPA: hypothetical protein VFD75_08815, partial [Pyrinomonadaceae bacterium]|nr:hypothetical protein [Pyrinomonadaceae bacterium]